MSISIRHFTKRLIILFVSTFLCISLLSIPFNHQINFFSKHNHHQILYYIGYYPKQTAHVYDVLGRVMNEMQRHNISAWLSDGSALGAVRHQGIIPWDKDIDIHVLSTNTILIEQILKDLNIGNHKNSDGKGPGIGGFGYSVGISKICHCNLYLDLWLFEESRFDQTITCKGWGDNGCKRWFSLHKGLPPPKWKHSDIFPLRYIQFGPNPTYKFPVPNNIQEYLTFHFGNWKVWK